MRVPGTKHLIKAGRWLRSRFVNGGLILGYHRVSENADDIYSICVRPQHFAEQLAVLRQHANLISLDVLIQGLQKDTLPTRAVVVTFDDGYADNLYEAMPLLKQYEIPITLFVATGYLSHRFWWDELVCLLLDSPSFPVELLLEIAGETHRWQMFKYHSENRHLLLEEIYQLLLNLTAEARQEAMGQLSGQIDVANNKGDCDGRALTHGELKQISRDELVTIGAHTVSHPVLTNMSPTEQQYEINQSKRDLEALLNQTVDAFSYPNGAADETTRNLLRQTGFSSACASIRDVAHSRSDLFNLPRFWIPDWDGDTFTHWLRHWLPGVSRQYR